MNTKMEFHIKANGPVLNLCGSRKITYASVLLYLFARDVTLSGAVHKGCDKITKVNAGLKLENALMKI